MTAAEFELAKRIAEELPLPLAPVRRRRHEASGRGRIDLRRTMLAMARQPQTLLPRFSQPRTELPTLIVLLDISGSMDRYARLMLHYVHGLTRRHLKVHTLTFGTRLTNITRALRNRDPDVALALAAAQVQDWKGGTRIASCLDDFNRHWARRLLGANAAVLLVSDGLDTDEHGELSRAAKQLRLYAHQIVWLNPLLRFDRFEPRAAGIRAILPHVDRFLPVHNLASLADLAVALRAPRVPVSSLTRAGGIAPRAPEPERPHGTARRPPHSRARRRDLGGAQRSRDAEGLHRRLRVARAHRRRRLHGGGGAQDRPGQRPLQGQPEDDQRRRRRPATRSTSTARAASPASAGDRPTSASRPRATPPPD